MKKSLCVCLLILFVVSFVSGCSSVENKVICTGTYYEDENSNFPLVPYVAVNTDDNSIYIGKGAIYDYAERGTYRIKEDKLLARPQNGEFTFLIMDETTLQYVEDTVNSMGFAPGTVFKIH